MKTLSLKRLTLIKRVTGIVGNDCPADYGLINCGDCNNDCNECWYLAVKKELNKIEEKGGIV